MPSCEIFRYSQLISFVLSKFNLLSGPLPLTTFELSCQMKGLFQGQVSMMCATLTDPTTKLPYMNQWEWDLNTTFEISDWQDIAYILSKVSFNTTLKQTTKHSYIGIWSQSELRRCTHRHPPLALDTVARWVRCILFGGSVL